MNLEILNKVAEITNINVNIIKEVMTMVEEGSTIPFIARYRKEKTQNLDEEQLRSITLNYDYQDKLYVRKNEVIATIDEKGKLTEELRKAINEADTLNKVEELYLPYKEKRKTKATIAIAKGLEPLADYLMQFLVEDYHEEAKKYLNDEVKTVEEALNGAKDILAERISDNYIYRDIVRSYIYRNGNIVTSIKKDAKDEKKTFENYYQYQESIKTMANHRIMAINRGETNDILKVKIELEHDNLTNYLINQVITNWNSPVKVLMKEVVLDAYNRLLFPSIEREIRSDLTQKSQDDSIKLFQENLGQLLLTPPFKNKVILGVDPAFRTGCKLAVINGNGDFIYNDVIYPFEKYVGEKIHDDRVFKAKTKLLYIINQYNVELIAIGNGTASRETEELIASVIKENKLEIKYIIVSEAGASVYSASPIAKEEFPNLNVEERSAISIARRVLDPLSELIKIEPKSIGVGQYQHDVNQAKLQESLEFTILKVVNSVGVNLNSASKELLSYVSGLNKRSAQQIVEHRKQNGKIVSRTDLKNVKGIGPKTFQQAVGFLKILDSSNPLDKTFIHPDDYKKVNLFINQLGYKLEDIGSQSLVEKLESPEALKLLITSGFGEFSAKDIIEELKRPLRDIRDEYPTPTLRNDILKIEDLKVGMKVEGTVRSIVDFGAFVDIGIKNDGLIHKSRLSRGRRVHPLEVVAIGDIVDVYIIDVNLEKERVGLSLFDPGQVELTSFNK